DSLMGVLLECREERQRKSARARVLRNRAQPFAEAVALAHVRLQMNRRQVAAAADALAIEVRDHALTGLVVLERDDVHEPRANVIVVVRVQKLDAVDVAQQLPVAGGDACAQLQNLIELLELPDPERGTYVVEAVVEAEPHVLEPAARIAAALVPQRAEQPPLLLGV